MKLHIASAAAIAAALIGSGVARADNLQLWSLARIYRAVDWPTVPQDGSEGGRRQADPEGQDQARRPDSTVDLYALVPDARHMAVGPRAS